MTQRNSQIPTTDLNADLLPVRASRQQIPHNPQLRTHVQQGSIDEILDFVRFMQVVGGYIERINEYEPEQYSIRAMYQHVPLTAQALA